MTRIEFLQAFKALTCAIDYPRDRKPKSLMVASEGFRKGTLGKKSIMLELKDKTLEELYDLHYKLCEDNQ